MGKVRWTYCQHQSPHKCEHWQGASPRYAGQLKSLGKGVPQDDPGHADQPGEGSVVCRWQCQHQHNIPNHQTVHHWTQLNHILVKEGSHVKNSLLHSVHAVQTTTPWFGWHKGRGVWDKGEWLHQLHGQTFGARCDGDVWGVSRRKEGTKLNQGASAHEDRDRCQDYQDDQIQALCGVSRMSPVLCCVAMIFVSAKQGGKRRVVVLHHEGIVAWTRLWMYQPPMISKKFTINVVSGALCWKAHSNVGIIHLNQSPYANEHCKNLEKKVVLEV